MTVIRVLEPRDVPGLFALMRADGDEWRDYWGDEERYLAAMEQCQTWVAVVDTSTAPICTTPTDKSAAHGSDATFAQDPLAATPTASTALPQEVSLGENTVIGFVRTWMDGAFAVHVLDLLVAPANRGAGLGRRLIAAVSDAHPGHAVYIHSDVDLYYEKQGFTRVGSLFQV